MNTLGEPSRQHARCFKHFRSPLCAQPCSLRCCTFLDGGRADCTLPCDGIDRDARRFEAAVLARHCGFLPSREGGVSILLPSGLQSITCCLCVDQSLEPPRSLLSCEHPFHCFSDAAGALHSWSLIVVTPERMGCFARRRGLAAPFVRRDCDPVQLLHKGGWHTEQS